LKYFFNIVKLYRLIQNILAQFDDSALRGAVSERLYFFPDRLARFNPSGLLSIENSR